MRLFRLQRTALLLSLLLVLAFSGTGQAQETWVLDPGHTSASFSVSHMTVSRVRGDFTEISGSGSFDGTSIASARVEAVIQVASIDTRNKKRDEHLLGADFFDAKRYPTITFTSKRFRPTSGRKFQLTGDLTIHGVTKTVVLAGEFSPVIKDPFGKTRVGAHASTTISRKAFGLVWSAALESGGMVVGDDVELAIDVEFTKR